MLVVFGFWVVVVSRSRFVRFFGICRVAGGLGVYFFRYFINKWKGMEVVSKRLFLEGEGIFIFFGGVGEFVELG